MYMISHPANLNKHPANIHDNTTYVFEKRFQIIRSNNGAGRFDMKNDVCDDFDQ